MTKVDYNIRIFHHPHFAEDFFIEEYKQPPTEAEGGVLCFSWSCLYRWFARVIRVGGVWMGEPLLSVPLVHPESIISYFTISLSFHCDLIG